MNGQMGMSNEAIKREVMTYVLASSSVPLIALDKETKRPRTYGSGMLFKSGLELYLFTALHNALLRTMIVQGDPCWQGSKLLMRNTFTSCWPIFKVPSLAKGVNGEPYLDASMKGIPVNDRYVRFIVDGVKGIARGIPLRRFGAEDVLLMDDPSAGDLDYCFCGTVEPGRDGAGVFSGGAQVEVSKFAAVWGLNRKTLDEYYVYFKLPDDFASLGVSLGGTSGAPILSSDGKVAALVCGGEDGDLVRGIRMDRILAGLSNGAIEQLPMECMLDETVCNDLMAFLDDDQQKFYWEEVRRGKLV